MDDRFFMKRAIRLAIRGTGRVSPNPRVGAVIVKDGVVLAEGFHARFGGPHAEADALSRLEPGAAGGSTLYVNLEPCGHEGKTPPCTDAIIRSGIRRVVIGVPDPNPLVAGSGIRRLRRAGLDVETGVVKEECERLNEAFFKFITRKKPFVTLKIAQTLDGKIAARNGLSKWITGEASRKWVHRLRAESDAVLIGIGTALADDPELTARGARWGRPRRIVLDSRARIPLKSRLMSGPDPEKTVIAAAPDVSGARMKSLLNRGVTVWTVRRGADGRLDLGFLLGKAAGEGVTSLLVEGGKEVFTSFLGSGLVDKVIVFTAPKLFGEGLNAFGDLGVEKPEGAVAFRSVRWRRLGGDLVFEGRPSCSRG
jgi:diaminohydroxyphosphoribosylaminopyrimidine deaminase / 5-amino-6-(5-phosphoribosylamino)uracil reductase